MSPSPRRHLTDRAVGRLVVLAVVAIAVGLAMPQEAAPGSPTWANIVSAAVVVFGAYGLFELASWAVGMLLARTPLSAASRLERGVRHAEGLEPIEEHAGPFRARQAFVLFGGYVAAQVAVFMPLGAMAMGEDGRLDTERLATLAAPGILVAMLCAAAVVGLLYKGQARRFDARAGGDAPATGSLSRAIGLRPAPTSALALAAVAGVLLAGVVMTLSVQVPIRDDLEPSILAQASQSSGLLQLAWVIAVVVVAPLLEEFLFRGAMYEGFRRSWGTGSAGVVVTVLFVGMHLPETWHYWPALLGITAGAVAMLIVRQRTGSLGPPVALHFGYNLTLAAAVLAATGG